MKQRRLRWYNCLPRLRNCLPRLRCVKRERLEEKRRAALPCSCRKASPASPVSSPTHIPPQDWHGCRFARLGGFDAQCDYAQPRGQRYHRHCDWCEPALTHSFPSHVHKATARCASACCVKHVLPHLHLFIPLLPPSSFTPSCWQAPSPASATFRPRSSATRRSRSRR